ncbi:MAG TPA: efflux RND transporter periplasmic adaptor subunit [Desulfobulbaceae bacterium]|nr:efflux RND transporter periplasmic adaptor subunit [Desulfobulbaceae bacterium]
MTRQTQQGEKPSPVVRLVLCLLILALGIGGFILLKKMKKSPPQRPVTRPALPVEVMIAHPRDFPVTIYGYGDVKARTRVTLSAEVSGRVLRKEDHLLAGAVVNKGDVLFTIDGKDYQLELETAKSRLAFLLRDLAIARAELKRVDTLRRKNRVGSISSVDKAEAAVNAIRNQIIQVRKTRDRAEIQLDRCLLHAPFTGRIDWIGVEADEYVTPGKKMITLVDDSVLEVKVPLDSRDAARWLKLQDKEQAGEQHWFARPEPVSCTVIWSEDDSVRATGTVDRIVSFDPRTRMIKVAVTLKREKKIPVPLVDGMFSRVTIPGRVLHNVYVVPREAVSFTGMVYVVTDGRLHSRKVEVVREENDLAVIDKGLNPGEAVITTRLEEPLENALVRVVGRKDQ